ncbi:MAG TPA: DUF885 domain-containing protein, partial [Thermoanaerobaculia bacterium]|nr:DUF885 domain-containing protein [Thermoanaerobaculia bacterium]
ADDAGLSDNSLAGVARWQAVQDATLAELRAISPDGLSPTARRTRRFLIDLLDAAVGKRVCRDELWAVSPTYTGWQAGFAYLASIQPVATAADRQAALARFGALPGWIDEEVENLRRGLELGYTAPRINVERVIEQMDSLTAGPPADSPFYSPAERAGNDPDFARRMGDTIEEGIDPAIRHYREFLANEYLPRAREEIAVTANPGGEDCYRASVRYHTSVEMGPQAIHRLGLDQMAKIAAQMQRIGAQSFGTGDVRELLELVTTDPRYTFDSRQEMVDYAEAAVRRAEQAVPRWFGLVPDAEVVVVPYPEFRERSAPGAEYSSASDDGSRPGTFYINTYEPESQSKAGIEATAFHETYPGHHLQGSIAKQFATGHPVQRYFGTSGFSEGWGLYSERLAEEMGIYSGDVDLLGLLSNEALRAARLVVDSGMHGLGWSRQQAIDYVLAHTAEPPTRAAAEVDRYIAVPGQATAYMIGNLEIRRLRDLAERELGEGFDVGEFHDRVLEDGAVTLPMLADKIQSWISDEKAAGAPGG